ncbi:YhbY family RNA-binding protein [Pseudoteredinibacter isoporae]|uniref:RNA-binding protein n=1 Tax=Pseudoteredinibacter isoporae TaxID=570281 RepID=A0A7X0MXQ5_9GAMM|nr:YhbY family RNA-binding protein [Pseudoteredinibacter isoporae]MBB6521207.1 RNA-binding protein [Pseudoteredinibacter isoporae]NHO86767.1 YhbY family RNA-binding protein [Pseudoteredinibacter isoporae]NIB24781.1 YhbY family RNA-binding protein [Pseudoteredinibacter isoporae]
MTLSADRKKQYRSLGHSLKPVVTIAGNGLSENVMNELDRALEDHELIKVKLVVADRDLRKQVIDEFCQQARCELVQEIGKVALVYRAAKKPNAKLSNISRV